MKRLTVLLVFLAGCGSGATQPPTARERVTPAMREACSLALASEIAAKITFFDILREEGFSRFDALVLTTEACLPENNPLYGEFCGLDQLCVELMISQCNACNLSVIDAVWR